MPNKNELPHPSDPQESTDENKEFYDTVKRYLLGMLSEEEKDKLDIFTFFVDEDESATEGTIEHLESAHSKLIDDYLIGNLSSEEIERFENYYLSEPENQARLKEEQELRDSIVELKETRKEEG